MDSNAEGVRTRKLTDKEDNAHPVSLKNRSSGFPALDVPVTELFAMRTWSPRRLKRELHRCKSDGLIDLQRGSIRLTPVGWEAANRATREHRLWELYLITHADVAPGRVDHDAERIEHVLEPAMIAELEQLLPAEVAPSAVPDCPHTGSGLTRGFSRESQFDQKGVQ